MARPTQNPREVLGCTYHILVHTNQQMSSTHLTMHTICAKVSWHQCSGECVLLWCMMECKKSESAWSPPHQVSCQRRSSRGPPRHLHRIGDWGNPPTISNPPQLPRPGPAEPPQLPLVDTEGGRLQAPTQPEENSLPSTPRGTSHTSITIWSHKVITPPLLTCGTSCLFLLLCVCMQTGNASAALSSALFYCSWDGEQCILFDTWSCVERLSNF